MNVFEDLVVELKEQNLLEETVIDRAEAEKGSRDYKAAHIVIEDEPLVYDDGVTEFDISDLSVETDESARAHPQFRAPIEFENVRQQVAEQMAELQMVEHLFNAVEREFMRVPANSFDDLPVKKTFHRFEQASADPRSDEYFEAESALLLELEAWGHALSARDKEIPSACLRRYSETAMPPLSPQALFALARFYRGAEYSEEVRRKFEVVVTRLFSKFIDGDRRGLLCSREEIVKHLKKRYADWSAASSYPVMADDPDVMLLVLTLEDFIVEAEGASDFGELAAGDFFERICQFKQSTGEMFFAPHVAAAAVESNIRIARKLVDMIAAEREQSDDETILAKYIAVDDRLLSEAVGRTLALEGLLDNGQQAIVEAELPETEADKKSENEKITRDIKRKSRTKARRRSTDRQVGNFLGVNQWMLLATVLSLIFSVGVYVWAEYFAGDVVTTAGVRVIDLGDPDIKQYVKTSKISGDMLYAVMSPAFEKLARADQEMLLKKMRQMGGERGYTRVSLLNIRGRAIGYASEHRFDLDQLQ
jgi:hypothetical protein